MTETAMTAETVKNRHGCLIVQHFVGQAKEGKALSGTAKTVRTTKTVMKATPLKLNPPFCMFFLFFCVEIATGAGG